MNLLKLYSVVFIVLLVCTLESDGGIIIGLLIKLIALKGALFLGTPIALGAFLMGQGVGFFAGNLAGGFAVLKTAQKFHESEKAKWKSPYKGWGWDDSKSQLFGKGYNKGFGIGSIISDFVNKQKGWQPEYKGWQPEFKGWQPEFKGWQPEHIYYGHGHGGYSDYHDDDHDYHPGPPPPTHFHYYPQKPSNGHQSSYSASPYYGAPSNAYLPKPPSMMQRIIGRIPGVSAIFGSENVGKGHGYSYTAGKGPVHNQYGHGGYSASYSPEDEYNVAQASYDGAVPYSFKGQDPSNTYQPGIFSAPSNANFPKYKPVSNGYSFEEGYKAAQSYSSPASEYESRPVSSYHDSSDGGGSSYNYAAQPSSSSFKASYDSDKYLPMGEEGYDDLFPGAAPNYDGPAKQYTGVMTDHYSQFQASKPTVYEKPIGKPMGPEDYSLSQEYSGERPLDLQGEGSLSYHVTGLFPKQDRDKRKNQKGSSKQESVNSHKSIAAPNHILEQFLESKLEEEAKKAKDEEQRNEAKELIKLLKQVYMQQLAASMKSKSSTERTGNFIPFPSIPNSTKPSAPAMSTTTTRVVVDTPQSTTQRPYVPSSTTPFPFKPTSEPTKFVHVSTISWLKKTEPKVVSLTGISPFFPEATSSRHKRDGKAGSVPGTTESKKGDDAASTSVSDDQLNLSQDQLQQLQLLYTFMEEIKQFFTLVSILDQDTCLQKMVCDVHANMASGEAQPQLSEYESNLISTFRIMDTLMPLDTSAAEDSSTKYRLAAKIGEMGKSVETCKSYYSLCGYSSDQIMNLGSQVEASQAQASPNSGTEPVVAESMSMSVSAFSSSASVTAMPRV